MSHDRNIVKGPHLLLDLNIKPVPNVEEAGVRPESEAPLPKVAEQPVPAIVTQQPPKPANPIPEIAEFIPDIPTIVPPPIHDVSDELGVEGIQSRFSVQKEKPATKRKPRNGNGKKPATQKRAAKK